MAITKQGNLLVAAPLHILQNKVTQKMLSNKTYHKALWEHLYNGATGNQFLSKDGAKLVHGLGAAVPEVKILADEAYHAGKGLKPILDRHGNSVPDLHTLAKIRRAAMGNYDALTRRPMTPQEIDVMTHMVSKMAPSSDPEKIREIFTQFTPEKAQALKQLVKENPLTGELLHGIAERSRMPAPNTRTKDSISMLRAGITYGRPSNVVANGALAVVDPVTAGINLTKSVAFSHDLAHKYKPVQQMQDLTNEYFVKKPMAKAFAEASNKKPGFFKRIFDNVINPDVVNPLNAYATQFSEGLGKIYKS